MYDPNTIYIPPGYGKISFSRIELQNILLAVGALTLAFTLLFTLHSWIGGLSGLSGVAFAFVISLVAVLTGFMLHEFAHKVIAQRNGAWAEFRAYPLGLMLAVVSGLFGIIFAAPGAVYIQGMINRKQNGLISIVGPLVNLVIGLSFLSLGLWMNVGILAVALYLIGWINITLAFFNMLPIPPLDGYKVLKWNLPVYIITFAAAVIPWGLLSFTTILG
jgi:Zn-dependent protease